MGKQNSSLVSDAAEATVFVDTSLGTHLAVAVDPNATVSALKRKIEHEHLLCFNSVGRIEVEALKVKRKGFFYHLSDSVVVRNAFRVKMNWFVSADAKGVAGKRLSNFNDSRPLLLEGSKRAEEKVTIVDQNGSVDSAGETSKQLDIRFKSSDNDHCPISFHDTTNRLEPEIQEDYSLHSKGYIVPKTQECKEDGSRKKSDVQCNASSEKAFPAEKKRLRKTKQRNEKIVQLKEDSVSVLGFGKEQSQTDIIRPENSSGNQSRDVICDVTIGKKTTTSKDVSQDMAAGNRNTTEEPCRSSASSMDNRSDSGIRRTTVAYKHTEVLGKHIESRENTSKHGSLAVSDTEVDDASLSQPAAKKKRKLASISRLEDSLKENDKVTSKPEIASEFSLRDKQKNASSIIGGLTAESTDLLTNSSRKKKKKNRKISPNSLDQVVAAAPSGRDVIEETSAAAAASGSNDKNSGGEDYVASNNEQGTHELNGISQKGNHCAPVQELWENSGVSSSLDGNNTADAGNVESKSVTAEEKWDGHPPPVFKVPTEGVTDSAQRVGEGRESIQRKDSESVKSEKKQLPGQGKKDKNDTKVIVTSELLDANGINTPNNTIKKKKKTRKTKGSIGETSVESGAEHIKGSENGLSLDEPHEAVHGEHASDKAKEEESNISKKNGTDVSEKETESSHIVMKTDKLGHSEVGTLEQNGKPQENEESMEQNVKKKSKRKRSAMTKDIPNLQAEAQNVGHQVPAPTTDKLEKRTPIEQSNEKALESDKGYGMETDSVPARSKSKRIEPTKVHSHALEHISDGRPLEASVTGNPPENGCSNEADKNTEVSCEGNKVNFDKHQMPSLGQHEVSVSGEVHTEVTRTNRTDDKTKKKRKKLDVQSVPSPDLQGSLKSNENQGIDGRSEAGNASSIQPQGSSSKGDDLMPHPQKKVSKKVPKTGTKAPTPDKSDKMNSISQAAGKHSGAKVSGTDIRTGKKNDSSAVLNSKLEKSNSKPHQNKMDNKRQSGVNRNRVASGKPYGIDYGEVVNSPEKRKSSTTQRKIFKDNNSSGSSEDEDEELSKASTQTPSDYSSSGYSDGESNADMSTPKSGKAGGGSVIKSCTSGMKDMNWDELAKSSSTFKKAKLTASQAQLEEDSEPVEFVPDSQPIS
ncbi:nucleolar and coiled-body phosphoprotein 1-like [Pyrus ussuriensis x Pyrus communis]|uniref:Nucleolar and coiled-body phosphoprotein 1-like n=1 Tax=Pyrus ussuriensis x Pyrus communis TaxID=2448454 RepID=A0A5N5G383_9ROSA|nr:nucleolar and coiled-body phosphoprotein 1-like [Pyrus ussuriensis x Pyrus communis]